MISSFECNAINGINTVNVSAKIVNSPTIIRKTKEIQKQPIFHFNQLLFFVSLLIIVLLKYARFS